MEKYTREEVVNNSIIYKGGHYDIVDFNEVEQLFAIRKKFVEVESVFWVRSENCSYVPF